jgi:predicted ATPase
MPSFMSDPEAMATLQSQAAFFEQTFAFFSAIAERRPVLLTLEDLHWSDHASLDLLHFIARQLHGHRVLLAVTYRYDEITRHHPLFQLLPSIVRESSAERVELRPQRVEAVRVKVLRRIPERGTQITNQFRQIVFRRVDHVQGSGTPCEEFPYHR